LPAYRSNTVIEVLRGVKAFLHLHAGVTRGEVPDFEREAQRTRLEIERLTRLVAAKEDQIARLRDRLGPGATKRKGRAKPENVVWIFGFGRSGSTWLSAMMADLEGHTLWREPLVGALFGNLYYNVSYYGIEVGEALRNSPSFVLGSRKDIWVGLVRSFILDWAEARFPKLKEDILVIKEPNGSVGAPLLMEALPESRMILLIRDPRDAMASALDAYSKGSWATRTLRREDVSGITAEAWLDWYLQNMNNARQAYEAHEGRKALVRYEDLRADTLGTMRRMYSALEIPVEDRELARVVEEHSWENIPEENKGEGKFYRKATPGSWREDLTPQQIQTVERITASVLNEFYS
jgi:hypothetical protein